LVGLNVEARDYPVGAILECVKCTQIGFEMETNL